MANGYVSIVTVNDPIDLVGSVPMVVRIVFIV